MEIKRDDSGNKCQHEDSALIPAGTAQVFLFRHVFNVVASFFVMCAAGSVYAWSIFVAPLRSEYGFSAAQTQLVFGIIIASFSITMLFVGRIQQKLGLRLTLSIGAVLFGTGYILASFSGGNLVIILSGIGVLSGAGMAFGYISVLSNIVKWYPTRKGLATGIGVAGFGSGAILLSQIAQPVISSGATITVLFRSIGIAYGLFYLLCAQLISSPPGERLTKPEKQIGFRQLARDRRFWVLFYTFFTGSFVGLMFIGNLRPIGIFYGAEAGVAVMAIVVVSVGNAVGRILWGQIYDRIGGKRSVLFALALMALLILLLPVVVSVNVLFLAQCLVIGLVYGANFVLYASDVSEIYGVNQLGSIYPIVSLAYGIAGIIGPPIGGWLFDVTSNYFIPIVISSGICLSGMAVYVLLMKRSYTTAAGWR
ncbi:MAG: MFS transporter [Dehalococcoidales bacterium]|nr:MFS transporter [Dehalococcoidales bacterium]